MTLIYRAIWEDALPDASGAADYIEKARRRFNTWAQRDGYERRPPHEVAAEADNTPAVDGQTSSGDREITLLALPGNEVGFEGITLDHAADGNAWTTRVRVRLRDQSVHVLVDNSVVGDDPTARIAVGRPGVIDLLLHLAHAPTLGSGRLQTGVLPCPADAVPVLVEHLRDPQRQLPVVVFTDRTDDARPTSRQLAERVARRSAGVAIIATLDAAGVTALRAHLGELAAWGGAARIYMPAPLDSAKDGWRHRFITPDRLRDYPNAAVDRLVASTAALSTRRAAPGLMAIFDTVTGDTHSRIEALQAENAALQEQVVVAGVDLDEAARELTRGQAHLARLQAALAERNLAELYWGTHDTHDDQSPDDVDSATEAVLVAQDTFSTWLAIPDDAAQDLEGIDTAPNSYAWANAIYRGLRALAAYAEQRAAGEPGDFWRWCETSGHPMVWSATPKKLAMRESETVSSSAKFMRARTLPVDATIDPAGKTAMVSHLKIAEGGGDLAPRVYFLDDTSGPTAKVHVGLIGPHYLVRNTRS